MTTGHSLPSLPHLPPLEMPDDSSTSFLPLPPPRPEDPNSASFSPTPSFAESFSTAYTSPSQADPDNILSRSGGLSLVSPSNLRKSLSVDSLVQYGREPRSAAGPRLTRGNTGSALDSPRGLVFGLSTDLQKERERHAQSGPNDESNNSSPKDDSGPSYVVDSDVERSDLLNSPVERNRHVSLKSQDQSRPPVRRGELPLPSRTPTLSWTSSTSSIMSTSTNSSTLEDVPRLQSMPSLQSLPGRSGTTAAAGRIRSGSLGMYPSNAGRRMAINTQISMASQYALRFDTFSSNPTVTIVVVGAAGCGKTVVIRKGLRGYGLSEPISIPTASNMQGSSPLQCVRRIGRVIRNENSPDCALHVIEVNIPTVVKHSKGLVWPESLSAIDGVIICYDSSDEASFQPVEGLLRNYRAMKLPIVVLSCKSDLERKVEPEKALEVLQQYDVGLVEVAKAQEHGKEKMRRTFEWLLKAVFRDRRTNRADFDFTYRNPASPGVLTSPLPLENSRTATPVASPSLLSMNQNQDIGAHNTHSPLPSGPPTDPLVTSNLPVRARSTGDLLYESERSKIRTRHPDIAISDGISRQKSSTESTRGSRAPADGPEDAPEFPENSKEGKEKEPRPAQWATLDELLDKLLFLAVSGDDPAFIAHFLLTYRRFASPRKVLLAMQKRMRQLDNPSGDPLFACFAQMRICHLLELWIRDYPYDFAVKGTIGALNALIKSIISKTYLLHYGSEFLPFLEILPNLVDQDAIWALKVDDTYDGSDDSYSMLDEEDETQLSDIDSTVPSNHSPVSARDRQVAPLSSPSRERNPSLPLPLMLGPSSNQSAVQPESLDTSPRQQIKDLVKLASEVLALDPDDIAQEITRVEVKLFLDIQPRHWLYYTFISGKKDEREPITAFNLVSNHLAEWVVSLILCHDKTKARVKQIEKFVEVAQRLRAMNNYSALRAFVAGINNATFPGDETMEQFKARSPDQEKNLRSWDVLLQHARAHRAYRLALRNSKGACIPALEVHMSDLIRAHEGNEDVNPSDPTKIHWGKFNMIGRFISSTAQCQAQCRVSNDYNFPDRNAIAELFVKRPVMNNEMQKSRIAPQDADIDDYPQSVSIQPRDSDVAGLRRLFSW